MAWNTGNVGVVKHPVKASNNRRNEIGTMTGGSIDGSLSATTVVQAPTMLPSSHRKVTNSQATRRVTPTADPPKNCETRVEKYDRPIEEWKSLFRSSPRTKHGELVAWLKAEHGLGHANALVAHHTLAEDREK